MLHIRDPVFGFVVSFWNAVHPLEQRFLIPTTWREIESKEAEITHNYGNLSDKILVTYGQTDASTSNAEATTQPVVVVTLFWKHSLLYNGGNPCKQWN